MCWGLFAILESLVPCGVRDFYGTEETWLETGGLWSFSTLFGWITNKFFFFFFFFFLKGGELHS